MMDNETPLGRKFHSGYGAAGALSYKTTTRFNYDDLSKHQNENSAVENELNVRRFHNGVFHAEL